MRIQYHTDGHWLECGDRADYFVGLAAVKMCITLETAYARLAAGELLAYDRPYEKVRDRDAQPQMAAPPAIMHCTKCGASGIRGDSPFTTLPESGRCDDCA